MSYFIKTNKELDLRKHKPNEKHNRARMEQLFYAIE
jgi:hypothetical protein